MIALLATLVAALVTRALWDYFGLTRPAGIVYATALPLLLLWFIPLGACYRLR